jgi:pilus assembly protein Flp/PilA
MRFLVSEVRPSAIESAVIAALILAACVPIVTTLGKSISNTFGSVNSPLGTGGSTSGTERPRIRMPQSPVNL